MPGRSYSTGGPLGNISSIHALPLLVSTVPIWALRAFAFSETVRIVLISSPTQLLARAKRQ
jgi:hypothetical protein